jgi:DNA modification methylase
MKQEVIQLVSPQKLKEGKAASVLYSIPENYEAIKENIKQIGILTPLHVLGNEVISGNLRLRVAKELNLDVVPVLYVEPQDIVSDELMAVSYGQQRKKKYSEILREYEILETAYPVGKGKRTDLDPEVKKNKEKLNDLILSKDKIYKLKGIKKLTIELFGEDSEEFRKIWSDVDGEKASLNSIFKRLQSEKAVRQNQIVLPEHYELNMTNAKVFNKSCSNMSEIEGNSVACIITSPPYFQMKDYGTGKGQRGLEKDIDSYIKGLIEDFQDCFRVIKDDGSLWVNLNEPVIDGSYNATPHRFVIAMIKAGWILNDEWIWIKNNPQFSQAKRAVRSHEYIFHFVKSKDYFYDVSWLKSLTDNDNMISHGTSGKVSNLLSSMDFRGNIVRTNSNNMEELRNQCKKRGFYLTHNAAFPITIPLISILTTSKVGDTILDIYSGTGTTGEAALATKRKYIGYEIKPEFVIGSEVRLSSFKEKEVISEAA